MLASFLPTPVLLLALALPASPPPASAPGEAVVLAGHLGHGPLPEVSGMAPSTLSQGIFWVLNDSSSPPRIFAITSDGKVIVPAPARERYHAETVEEGKKPWPGVLIRTAENVDWEDIAAWDGKLWIADTGNNFNRRTDLCVYVVPEPDPRRDLAIDPIRRIPISYPEQTEIPGSVWEFDCEAIFVDEGALHLLTKHRRSGQVLCVSGTRLYRLEDPLAEPPGMPALVDRRDDIGIVTGASLSPDGKSLAVVAYEALWLFRHPDSGSSWLRSARRRLALPRHRTLQVESVCWEGDSVLLLTNEQRDVFRVPVADIPEWASGLESATDRSSPPPRDRE